jgi:hypothetical protein
MTVPSFSEEASLYASSAGRLGSVLAQSLFCARLGETCGGIDLTCCPGLRCTAGAWWAGHLRAGLVPLFSMR